jgi:hypothetical protein
MKMKRIFSWLGVFSIIASFLIVSAIKADVNFDFTQMWVYRIRFYQGFILTVQISLFSMLLSLILGIVGRSGPAKPLDDASGTWHQLPMSKSFAEPRFWYKSSSSITSSERPGDFQIASWQA